MPTPPIETVTLARYAMATRFEIVLHGPNPANLRAAGEEALDEIQRLEAQLNLHSNRSELAQLNARAAHQPVKVEPGFFHILQNAQRIHLETAGAFDITIAPLMRCWGFVKGSGHLPDPEALAEARSRVGMHLVELDPGQFTVRYLKEGVTLDLGAIGKGYAIEAAAGIFRENGIGSALIHGGTSSLCALGHPPGLDAWKVAIEFSDTPALSTAATPTPPSHASPHPVLSSTADSIPNPSSRILAIVPLRDQAMSVSAVWGKAFQSGGKTLGHVLDPRTGHPAAEAMLAAVVLPSAMETDAYSTALLIRGREAQAPLRSLHPAIQTLVAGRIHPSGPLWIEAQGIDPLPGAALPPSTIP